MISPERVMEIRNLNVFALRQLAQEQDARIAELTTKLNSYVRVGTALLVKRETEQQQMMGVSATSTEILWLKRAGSHAAGTWTIPGGWMDKGEDPADAVLREAREECGPDLVFDTPWYLGATNDVFDEGVHSFCLFYSANLLDGEPRIMEPKKATAMEWRAVGDWPDPMMLGIEKLRRGETIR